MRSAEAEIGLDLEQLGEVGIEFAQAIEQPGLAEQHDLQVERDGLRLDRHGLAAIQNLGEVLDLDLGFAQGALERFPGDVLLQQLERIDQQEAAIGNVQAARLDEHEVSDDRHQQGDVLHLADQIGKRRQGQRNDGRAARGRIVDQEVDLVTVEGNLFAPLALPLLVATGARLQRVDMRDEILVDRVEIGVDRPVGIVAAGQRIQQIADDGLAQLAVERAHAFLRVCADGLEPFHRPFELVLQLARTLAQPLAVRLRQPPIFVVRERQPIALRREVEMALTLDQREALALRRATQCLQRAVDSAAELFLDGPAPLAIVFALEQLRHGRLKRFDELPHRVFEHGTFARGEAQRRRPVRRRKIVDVAPVGRRRHIRRETLERAADRTAPAAALRTGDEDVVAGLRNPGAEGDGAHGAVLADGAGQIGQARRGVERQACWIGLQAEPVRGHGLDHSFPITPRRPFSGRSDFTIASPGRRAEALRREGRN